MEDLRDLKVGDKVWTIQLGDCEVISIDLDSNYHIRLKNSDEIEEDYTLKGFYNENDKHQSLFRSNPLEKKQDFEPRWMMVSDNEKHWYKRFVFMVKNNFYISWFSVEDDEGVAKQVSTVHWKSAKEIKQLEVTIEEIAEKFGVSVEQIKIKE